ncbi:LrgB family protein [Indiicoccus explosivorum]|uniref:LrgB family protein n=1 Tax=Indiicoccus explosivorum TaxID=1917864 RepID=UPI000B4487AD|nr:LrgB family protein [Indiicoccus explosivorum]
MELIAALVSVAGTLFAYRISSRLYEKFPLPLFHPVLTTCLILVLALVMLNVPYAVYMLGGKWIDELLGPAVVALAYPLYTQRMLLLRHWKAVLSGVAVSLAAGLITIWLFARLTDTGHEILLSMLPKSITTPVAIGVSAAIGGIPSMTVAFVMTAGFTGAVIGPAVLKLAGVKSETAVGLALGSASHGIGLTKAAESGDRPLSMGSVAMTLSAIFGAGAIPSAVYILMRFWN